MIEDYFLIQELVCPEVFDKYGKTAWQFFDEKLLINLFTIRDRINKPIFVNNWDSGGQFTQRGLRCNQCSLPKDKTIAGDIYLSAHCLGKGVDFDIMGMLAEETRQWIIKHQNWWPYSLRLEEGTSWVHMDVFVKDQKVTLFKP